MSLPPSNGFGTTAKCFFICHASEDADVAKALDRGLREAGYRTWMAPRDVNPAVDYALGIMRGIETCDEMLILGTHAAYESGHVVRETDLAIKGGKGIRALFIDEPSGSMSYYLASPHGIVTTRDAAVSDVLAQLGPAAELWRYRHLNRETVYAGGHEITYSRWGIGRGDPVLLLHDFGGSADDWNAEELLTVMQSFNATFLGVDLPGHHSNWAGEHPSLPEVTPILASLITALELSECHVVGCGLGGLVALHLASRDPRVVGCIAGMVGLSLWEGDAIDRGRLMSREDTTDRVVPPHPSRPEVHGKLLAGRMPRSRGLSRVSATARVLAWDDDLAEAKALARTMNLPPVVGLRRSTAKSERNATFLTSALHSLGIGSRETQKDPGGVVAALTGLTGVGKTVLAEQAAPQLDALHLKSDRIRRQLVAEPTYSVAEGKQVWENMAGSIRTALEDKKNVILDATFSTEDARTRLHSWLQDAECHGYRTTAIWLDAEETEISERVASRAETTLDWNGADVAVLKVMMTRTSPHWVGNRFDVTGLSPKAILNTALPLLTGTVVEASGWRYLHMHAAMNEASHRLRSTGRWPREGSWVDVLLTQIDVDVQSRIFERWGESTLLQGDVSLVADCVPVALSARAGYVGTMGRLNAGLAHAYAYLLSDVFISPYGFKRDRWLDGRIGAVLGVRRGFIDPSPIQGTLLGNVTHALDSHFGDVAVEWVDASGTRTAGTLLETDPATGVTFETRVFTRDDVRDEVLVYSIPPREPDFVRKYLTVFPVPPGHASILAETTRNAGALRPRYNAVPAVELSSEPAVRVYVPGTND